MPKFKGAISQTILYGFSIVIMKGISIFMLPFIAHQLTQQAFGRLEIIASLAVIGSIIVGLGLEDTLYRFAGQAKTQAERKKQAAEIFGLTLIIGVLALMAGWIIATVIASWLPGNFSTYEIKLVLFMLAMEGIIAIPLGWLRMQNRAVLFFCISIFRAALQASLIIFMLKPGSNITPILEAGLISGIAQCLILCYLQIKDTGVSISTRSLRPLLIYSLPIVGSGFMAFILNGLDRWILADQTSLTDVAEYGVAAKFALAAILLLQPFGMWWSPRRFEISNKPDGKTLSSRAITIGIILSLTICVAVSTGAPVLIGWLMPDSYVMAAQYALGLIIAVTLKELSELVNIGCFIHKSTLAQLMINLITALIGLSIMLILVSEQGVWGVILALNIAQLARLILFYLASQHYFYINYPLWPIFILSLEAIIWMLISMQSSFSILNQLAFSLLATTMMLVTAVVLQLIPFDLNRLLPSSKGTAHD